MLDETRFSSITRPKHLHQSSINKEIDIPFQSSPSDDQEIIKDEDENASILCRSKRQRKDRSFGRDFEVYVIENYKK